MVLIENKISSFSTHYMKKKKDKIKKQNKRNVKQKKRKPITMIFSPELLLFFRKHLSLGSLQLHLVIYDLE